MERIVLRESLIQPSSSSKSTPLHSVEEQMPHLRGCGKGERKVGAGGGLPHPQPLPQGACHYPQVGSGGH